LIHDRHKAKGEQPESSKVKSISIIHKPRRKLMKNDFTDSKSHGVKFIYIEGDVNSILAKVLKSPDQAQHN